jgi:antibiotic biosynthesis monooxygenase (ABM) superfamily enzyme
MKRRTCLATLATVASGALTPLALAADPAHPIQVHVDMSVDPAKEKDMLRHFEQDFKPAAAKFPGYIDVKIVKLRSAFQGIAPAGLNYRFILTYENEQLRQKWIASDIHQKVWGMLENTMRNNKDYAVLLFDVA